MALRVVIILFIMFPYILFGEFGARPQSFMVARSILVDLYETIIVKSSISMSLEGWHMKGQNIFVE